MSDHRLIELPRGFVTKVDAADYDWLREYNWLPAVKRGKCYVVAYRKSDYFIMHRLITEAKTGQFVDHISGDTLDNRRCNLRICTNAENIRNMKKNGFRGVTHVPRNKKKPWMAVITFNYKIYYLGYHATKDEAARSYDKAAAEFFGEFARLNFPSKQVDD